MSIYSERHGKLDRIRPTAAPIGPKVVWSSLSRGSAASLPAHGILIRHVARGEPVHQTIGGRQYKVEPGQFICIPERTATEVEIRRGGVPTEGFCLLLPVAPALVEAASALEAAVVLPTQCSVVGRQLTDHARQLQRPFADLPTLAGSLLRSVSRAMPALLSETHVHLDALDLVRPSTRYDVYCRLNRARTYLHDVTDRPVELAALARIAGMSRFHLLRRFQDCFGVTPAAYHRALRLKLARDAIEAERLACAEAAERFGFADGSSFSHAYRRQFGASPMRALPRRGGLPPSAHRRSALHSPVD